MVVRELTAGWVPYSSSSERGRFRSCLPNPDLLRIPPDFIRLRGCKDEQLSSQLRLSRRRFVQYNIAAATALGVSAGAPARARGDVFTIVAAAAVPIVLEAAEYFLLSVAGYAARAVGREIERHLVDVSNEYGEAFKSYVKKGVEFIGDLLEPLILPPPKAPYFGPGSDFHWKSQAPKFGYPGAANADTNRLPALDVNFGINQVQYQYSNASHEQLAMKRRSEKCETEKERLQCFCLPSFYRAKLKDLTDGKRDVLALVNDEYTEKGDEPIRPEEITSWIPMKGDGGRGYSKNYTGFNVLRNGEEFFLYAREKKQ